MSAGGRSYAKALNLYKEATSAVDEADRKRLLGMLRDMGGPHNGAGAPYPELEDPEFVAKLLAKKEFAFAQKSNKPPNCQTGAFTLSTTQKLLRNLLSPYTPYNGVLVFHGVGQGKTCAAIQIAESFKGVLSKRVLVITPPSLKDNFKNQLHDPGAGREQCTGLTYEGKLGAVDAHYQFVGYERFANVVERVCEQKGAAADNHLRAMYSDTVIIIDEVQNLRRVQNRKKGVSAAIERVLAACTGVRLVLLTATPLYNDVEELRFLMQLLLLNDKDYKNLERVKAADFKSEDGALAKSDREVLMRFSSRYVSYLRGENPYTFPVRLYPRDATTKHEQNPLLLPLLITHMPERMASAVNFLRKGRPQEDAQSDEDESEEEGNADGNTVQELLQASNIVFPDGNTGMQGFATTLKRITGKGERVRLAYNNPAQQVLAEEHSAQYSPKINYIVKSAKSATGVVLVYSRYLPSGLLPLAVALEHAGFVNTRGNIALDIRRNTAGVAGKPPRYAIISGDADFSVANVEKSMATITSPTNMNGDHVKVVLISSKAAEGFDFKFVRELHVMEPWYNLSRVEQIIGRGVRNCSHKLLPANQRNCTVYLHCTGGKQGVDMGVYLLAQEKQKYISQLERVLKEAALDCQLNKRTNHFPESLFQSEEHVDSQGNKRQLQRGDQDFSRACDFQKCRFACAFAADATGADTSTFNDFFVEHEVRVIMDQLVGMFNQQVYVSFDDALKALNHPDPGMLARSLDALVLSREHVSHAGVPGYVVKRKDAYLFQPFNADQRMTRSERVRATRLTGAPRRIVQVPVMDESTFDSESTSVSKSSSSATVATKTVAQVLSTRVQSLTELLTTLGVTRPDASIVMDMIIDGLDMLNFEKLARAPDLNEQVVQSLMRGHYICSIDADRFLFNFHNQKFIQMAPRGRYVSSLKNAEVASVHVRQLPARTQRLGFISTAKGGRAVFKMVVVKQKREQDLQGVVCARFPQLKKSELVALIKNAGASLTDDNAHRSSMCTLYEYALRATGSGFQRPVHASLSTSVSVVQN